MTRPLFFATVLCTAVLVARAPRPTDTFALREQLRVRAHFDSAEREVRSHPVGKLSQAQRAARARALDRLHAYAARGVFPRNWHFPGTFVPSFVDDRTGTRCGMAYLIEESRSAGFVARIAATNNNATIPDLKDDPEMIAWLDRNGLTLEEAARIQPKYCGPLPPGCYCGFNTTYCPTTTSRLSAGYKVTTGVTVGVDIVAVALNVMHAGRARPVAGAVGIVTGVAGIAIGAPNFDESGSRRTLGFVNAGMGAVTAAFGVYRLAHKPAAASPVSFAPWFSASGASGLGGRISF